MAKKLSVYLSYLLRHNPEDVELHMDKHGWVSVNELIKNINSKGVYSLNFERLKMIVANDKKGRYRFNDDFTKIKACQGHSIPWVEPELTVKQPPDCLYHGTTAKSKDKIYKSGYISKMKRHAVHMQDDFNKAWTSAIRWKNETPVVLIIDAKSMYEDGYEFAISDNGVWCTEKVPVKYIYPKFDQLSPSFVDSEFKII